MPNEEWGVKRLCPTTGKRFYDLGRDPIISPYTGEVVTFDLNNKARVAVTEKASAKSAKGDLLDDDDDVLLDDEDGDDVDIDLDDDLLDDEDDGNVSLDDLADVAADDDD
ncbi:MAG: FYDLN acid domain-containing protein [Paracoccaceae bacterium]